MVIIYFKINYLFYNKYLQVVKINLELVIIDCEHFKTPFKSLVLVWYVCYITTYIIKATIIAKINM